MENIKFYTVKELAKELRMSGVCISEAAKKGLLKSSRIGINYIFSLEDIRKTFPKAFTGEPHYVFADLVEIFAGKLTPKQIEVFLGYTQNIPFSQICKGSKKIFNREVVEALEKYDPKPVKTIISEPPKTITKKSEAAKARKRSNNSDQDRRRVTIPREWALFMETSGILIKDFTLNILKEKIEKLGFAEKQPQLF